MDLPEGQHRRPRRLHDLCGENFHVAARIPGTDPAVWECRTCAATRKNGESYWTAPVLADVVPLHPQQEEVTRRHG